MSKASLHRIGIVLVATIVSGAGATYGQTTAFTYQGQLTASGAPADGSYDLRAALFDTIAGGAQIGSTQTVNAVPVNDGVFTLQLDFGVNAFPGANRFVEISVRPAGNGNYTMLAPRQQISSSPYAIRTLSAASADALSSACVGCVQDSQIQGVSGSKVTGTIPAAGVPGGSGNYVQNTTTMQASSNFNISGNGVVGGNLTVNGTLNANVSGNFVQNRTTPQSNANFNVAGTGTVGGTLTAANAAIGMTSPPAAGITLDVSGPARVIAGGNGGSFQIGTPGGETGLSMATTTNRADLRFNNTTLKLVAGPGTGPPGPTSGLSINTAGRVGVGIDDAASGRLHVVNNGSPAIYAESDNRAVWGRSTGGSRGVYGDSVSGEGVHGQSVSGTGVVGSTAAGSAFAVGVSGVATGTGGVGVRGDGNTGVYGVSSGSAGVGVTGVGPTGLYGAATTASGVAVLGVSTGVAGAAMVAQGHAAQTLAYGGWVKAMAYVNTDGSILRCYNSQASGFEISTPPCGIDMIAGPSIVGYGMTFPFSVAERYVSVTVETSGEARTGVNYRLLGGGSINVYPFVADDPQDTIGAKAPFTIIIF